MQGRPSQAELTAKVSSKVHDLLILAATGILLLPSSLESPLRLILTEADLKIRGVAEC